ncbi:MAG: mannose-6-phosphate isomerase, class I [Jiangellaceae bacterium]
MAYLLDNPVRDYAWGSPTVIPDLLGRPATGEPQAELWLGAHGAAPSLVRTESGLLTLPDLVARDPERMLGPAVVARFGARLPFLLKVLAVERPLSIQVHPTTTQAEEGYAAEDAAGVPLAAPDRSYRDPFHKPEVVVALSDFEALAGFREPSETAALIATLDLPALGDVERMLTEPGGLAGATRWMLEFEPVLPLVDEVVQACTRRAGSEPFGTVARIAADHPGDRGVLLALLLDLVRLRPGQACAVPAGTPHAYLRGVVVEAQASSDNTLRAGLTPKHVDAPEVLRTLRYEPAPHLRLVPRAIDGVAEYGMADVAEFRLSRVRLGAPPTVLTGSGPAILLVTEGQATLTAGTRLALARGASAFVPADCERVELAGDGTAFVVTTAVEPTRYGKMTIAWTTSGG